MNMLKRLTKKLTLLFVLLFPVFEASAQEEAYNAYSPYSMFGIGDLSKQGTAWNKSMGGVGIASRNKKYINILNPAAVTAREAKEFKADFGLAQGNRIYRQGDFKSANNTFNIYDFVISFPVYKSIAMYAGFTPYSDLGYSVTSSITDPDLVGVVGNLNTQSQGFGDLSSIFIGAGFSPVKGLSAGVEYTHIFGKLEKQNVLTFSNSSYRSINSGYDLDLKADAVKFGLQYDFPVANKVSVTVGATYKLSARLKGNVVDYEYSVISSVIDTTRSVVTNLSKSDDAIRLASEFGVGINVHEGEKWAAEINYINSDWKSSGMDKVPGFANIGNAAFGVNSYQSLRAGFSIIPNENDIRYYRKRITYRAGAYWDQAYCTLDGNDINAFGVTFGVTLPVKWSISGVTLGVDAGQRGSLKGNLIRENYVNFNIGINICDIWFLKYKYD